MSLKYFGHSTFTTFNFTMKFHFKYLSCYFGGHQFHQWEWKDRFSDRQFRLSKPQAVYLLKAVNNKAKREKEKTFLSFLRTFPFSEKKGATITFSCKVVTGSHLWSQLLIQLVSRRCFVLGAHTHTHTHTRLFFPCAERTIFCCYLEVF